MMTVTQAPCSHCGGAEKQVNPLGKPEMVLVCALATFLISAVFWSVTKNTKHPVPVKKTVAAQSEIDRLFAQAKTSPPAPPQAVVKQVPQEERKVLEEKSVETSVEEKPAVERAITEVKPAEKHEPFKLEEPTVSTEQKATTKASVTEQKSAPRAIASKPDSKVDEVAEYNRKLADFFSRKKSEQSPATDTVDGATGDTITAEPPAFDEWLQAGKPQF